MKNSFFNKQQHVDAVDDEKNNEAQHRALAKMAMGLPMDPVAPAIPVVAPASPFAAMTAALMAKKPPRIRTPKF